MRGDRRGEYEMRGLTSQNRLLTAGGGDNMTNFYAEVLSLGQESVEFTITDLTEQSFS